MEGIKWTSSRKRYWLIRAFPYACSAILLLLAAFFFLSTIERTASPLAIAVLVAVPGGLLATALHVFRWRAVHSIEVSDESITLSGISRKWEFSLDDIEFVGMAWQPIFMPSIQTSRVALYPSPFMPGSTMDMLAEIRTRCPNLAD